MALHAALNAFTGVVRAYGGGGRYYGGSGTAFLRDTSVPSSNGYLPHSTPFLVH